MKLQSLSKINFHRDISIDKVYSLTSHLYIGLVKKKLITGLTGYPERVDMVFVECLIIWLLCILSHNHRGAGERSSNIFVVCRDPVLVGCSILE